MEIKMLRPQGYCAGVITALNKIKEIAKTEKKVYLLGMLIHNKDVCNALETLGITIIDDQNKTRLELLDMIPNDATVCFTAHGVSDAVYEKALQKNLKIYDLSCIHVLEVKNLCKKFLQDGYEILYIGKKGHPEAEGILGLSNKIHLITNKNDLQKIKINCQKIIITNQTTLSIFDCEEIYDAAKLIFPEIKYLNKICNATTIRQEAVLNQDLCDLCIVVGDKLSSNTQKLMKVSTHKGINTILVENLLDLDINLLYNVHKVNITSGASTCKNAVLAIVKFLENFDYDKIETHDKTPYLSYEVL